MSTIRDVAQICKALAEHHRLRILKMLELQPLCVCEITAVLQLATSTVSKHLSILRDAGLIIDQKDGKWVNYCLNDLSDLPQIKPLLSSISSGLVDDRIIQQDAENVKSVDRYEICNV
ncbi:MAG: ArsR/SmtB family transcription factor [Candidatus Neomarinimicrobiota bacterium]